MSQTADDQLKRNINDQLDRLVRQLADLEEYKTDLEPDEYESMKAETMDQLREFSDSLEKMSSGNMTSVDELAAMKLAVRAAIGEAFRTPEVIALFARKQPAQLRLRLAELERDHKIRKVGEQVYVDRKIELIIALQNLKETLSDEERRFLDENSADSTLAAFQKVVSELDSSDEKVMSLVNSATATTR